MKGKFGLDVAGVTCNIVTEIHIEEGKSWRGQFYLTRMKAAGQSAFLEIFSAHKNDPRNAIVRAILAHDIIEPLPMVKRAEEMGERTIRIELNSPDPNANFLRHFLPALVDAIPRVQFAGCENRWVVKHIIYDVIGHGGHNVEKQLMNVAKTAAEEVLAARQGADQAIR